MEREISKQPMKWEATVSAQLKQASADQIWPLLKDFFGIYKYFPSLSTSYGVHGNNGEMGSIRYCEGSRIPAKESREKNDGGRKKLEPTPVSWSKEKLIDIDPIRMSLSYEMVDSNLGFTSYVSTIRIHQDESIKNNNIGCVLQWSFSVDPVEGLEFEDLVDKYRVGLQKMARKLEDSSSSGKVFD
ncbi:OLC1v1029100C1 [Oldenlandia corymbosa var. corymbosa]|uniref:OLC1v1029100C1 n=1 Tax=Oldenlandia corymbosa var. corymbosa TaxID=529605 RepID=A0AAV1CD85_OLDCO|nr:OLC1v1029100C1 [Oldenlandia corymbosa var. corymbosa]